MKKYLSFITIFLIIICTLGFSVNASEVNGITNQYIYTLKNVNSNKYLNVHMGYDVDNTNVYQWTADGSTEQKFRFVYDYDEEAYRIFVMSSANGEHRVLDIVKTNGVVSSGCNVQIYRPIDNVAQLWVIEKTGSNYIIKPKSNTSVALTSYGTSNGTATGTTSTSTGNVYVSTNTGSANQKWEIAVVSSSGVYDRNYFASPTNNIGSRTQDYIYNEHYGVDIGGVSTNTSLYAVGDGVATFKYAYKVINNVTYTTSWGNHIELQTPGIGMIRYAHLSNFANNYSVSPYADNYRASTSNSTYVKTGEKNVNKNEYIGKIGNTGYSLGVHLHFEYLINGTRVNPDYHVVLPGGPSGTFPYITYE